MEWAPEEGETRDRPVVLASPPAPSTRGLSSGPKWTLPSRVCSLCSAAPCEPLSVLSPARVLGSVWALSAWKPHQLSQVLLQLGTEVTLSSAISHQDTPRDHV